MSNKITGTKVLLNSLVESGVDTIFGYPGGQIMPFMMRCMTIRIRLDTSWFDMSRRLCMQRRVMLVRRVA